MRHIVLDTNTFLRFFFNDIPDQKQRVQALFEKAKQGKVFLLVPQIVVFEIHFTLSKYYNFSKEEILIVLKAVVVMEYLHVQDRDLLQKALELFQTYNKLSLADCFTQCYAEKNDAELFMFDRDLGKPAEK